MSDFNRSLRTSDLETLQALAAAPSDNLWKDLLRLWRPAGFEAERQGLRVAVRNRSLNFYLRGQSVARIGFADGCPFAEMHAKYADPDEGQEGAEYVRLVDEEFWYPKTRKTGNTGKTGKTGWRYGAVTTIDRLIRRADEKGGSEKAFVDDLVSDNGSVIDLEMGLPGWAECKTAKRMDLVALESTEDRLRIVFWEAKTIGDSRLRSSTIEKLPEVWDQLEFYIKYLGHPGHPERVGRAYRDNCHILCSLHRIARQVRPEIEPLDESIVRASETDAQPLLVDPRPRLAIFENVNPTASWPSQEARLRELKIPVMRYKERPYVLH